MTRFQFDHDEAYTPTEFRTPKLSRNDISTSSSGAIMMNNNTPGSASSITMSSSASGSRASGMSQKAPSIKRSPTDHIRPSASIRGISYHEEHEGYGRGTMQQQEEHQFNSYQQQHQSSLVASSVGESPLPPSSSSPMFCSVRLTCLSPDQRTMHTLIQSQFIQSHHIPMGIGMGGAHQHHGSEFDHHQQQQHEQQQGGARPGFVVRTQLTPHIQSMLQIDPPVEIICLDDGGGGSGGGRKAIGDEGFRNSTSKKDDSTGNKPGGKHRHNPRFCLYTRKSAFVIQLAYSMISSSDYNDDYDDHRSYHSDRDSPVQGEIISVHEPFESFLAVSLSTSIQRIRMAPQRQYGFATLCPLGSMAVLTFNHQINEYSLLLLHGSDGCITYPLVFQLEDLADQHTGEVIDFCFGQSTIGLPLFPSLSILLLRKSGDVHVASPIVFDQTILPRTLVRDSLDYLDAILMSEDRTSVKWRQCRATQQYLIDVFGEMMGVDQRHQFVTARVTSLQLQRESAAIWPIKLQGPILCLSDFFDNDEASFYSPYSSIESFRNPGELVGIAIGTQGCTIDLAALSPTALLPRFAFEPSHDTNDLDDEIFALGMMLERVYLVSEDNAALISTATLVHDPIDHDLLHVVTSKSLFTISTNIMSLVGQKMKEQRTGRGGRRPSRTTAWSCLQLNNPKCNLQGIVIPNESYVGHTMIAALSDGTLVPLNITNAQSAHELSALFERPPPSKEGTPLLLTDGSSTKDPGLSMPPLFETVGPYVKQIMHGLENMGIFVGSKTNYKDISPHGLAVLLRIKERCDMQLVLPMLEMNKLVQARRNLLRTIMQSQQNQLTSFQKSIADVRRRMKDIVTKLETVESNGALLSSRAAIVLQAYRDLTPTVTKAEQEFFNDIKRLDEKANNMETELKRLQALPSSQNPLLIHEQLTSSTLSLDISMEDQQQANTLLADQEIRLKRIDEFLKQSAQQTNELMRTCGLTNSNTKL